jgi:hypothetical protein
MRQRKTDRAGVRDVMESIIEQSIRMLGNDPRDVIDVDYPDFEITEHMRSAMRKMPIRSHGAHLPVRIAAGLFFTDEEWEGVRGRALGTLS